MSIEHRTRRKSTDPRPNYLPLGRDAEGREHVYRPFAEEVVVIRDRQRTHVEQLGDRSVGEWLAYVADRTGWARVDYGLEPTGFTDRFVGGVAL